MVIAINSSYRYSTLTFTSKVWNRRRTSAELEEVHQHRNKGVGARNRFDQRTIRDTQYDNGIPSSSLLSFILWNEPMICATFVDLGVFVVPNNRLTIPRFERMVLSSSLSFQ